MRIADENRLYEILSILKKVKMQVHPDKWFSNDTSVLFISYEMYSKLYDAGLLKEEHSPSTTNCTCGEINARHCPVHNEGEK